jgi:uncharacterized membrane protein YgcG
MLAVLAVVAHSILSAAPPGWVRDEASLLSADDVRELEDASNRLFETQGIRVGVVTLTDTLGRQPKQVAVDTLNDWAPGPRSALVLVSLNPRELWLQPGTQLATVLDEPTSRSICQDTLAPEVRVGRAKAGLMGALWRIGQAAAHPAAAAPVSVLSGLSLSRLGSFPLILGLLVAGLGVFFGVRRMNQPVCNGCGRRGMTRNRQILEYPTTLSSGTAEETYTCGCGSSLKRTVTLAMLGSSTSSTDSSWSSDSFGSSDLGGGGGDSGGSSSDGSGGGGSSW